MNREQMPVTLGPDVLHRFRRFTLYNSPYVAHEDGRAIDLYPPAGAPTVHSPVTGTVREALTVTAPPKPYAESEDHLLLVDTGDHLARLMHVEPTVHEADTIDVGDPLGRPVRAGFFAPWVPNHLHLEFRPPDVDPYRASGSVPLAVDLDIGALDWDGTGTVEETGETWARLDAPAHPDPGESFVGFASGGGVLDGGLPHYEWGGVLGGTSAPRLAGSAVGTRGGRTVDWHDLTVLANGEPVTGLACYVGKDSFGAKLVGEAVDLNVGDDVRVRLRRE